MRGAAPVRHPPGRNSLDYRCSVGARKRGRRTLGESPAWPRQSGIESTAFACSRANRTSLPGQGFSVAQREDLPDKIYKDCHACPRFHCCDEVAMVRGDLPKFAILPEPANWLVKLQGWSPSVDSSS